MTRPIPYKHLDPGVRELVRQLASLGFTPTDSGDGYSKKIRVFDFLHVAMVTEPADLVREAERLQALLPTLTPKSLTVEATYRPTDNTGILFLFDEAQPQQEAR